MYGARWGFGVDVEIDLEILQYFSIFIHSQILEGHNRKQQWLFTEIYGHPKVAQHKETWNVIRRLCREVELPCLIMRDFNEILSADVKWKGGRMRPERQMELFQKVLNECDLRYLEFFGQPFTWCNQLEGANQISERLDRFLANSKWCLMFLENSVTYGVV